MWSRPDIVIIAGNICDKSAPSVEAVGLFDDFLYRLSLRNLQVFYIGGNHDSAECTAFATRRASARQKSACTRAKFA